MIMADEGHVTQYCGLLWEYNVPRLCKPADLTADVSHSSAQSFSQYGGVIILLFSSYGRKTCVVSVIPISYECKMYCFVLVHCTN